jgi:hypothetical protein
VVEVLLQDAEGKTWHFIDKVPIFDESWVLAQDTDYPVDLQVACTILGRHTRDGRLLARISTASPCGLETVDGRRLFELTADRVSGGV